MSEKHHVLMQQVLWSSAFCSADSRGH